MRAFAPVGVKAVGPAPTAMPRPVTPPPRRRIGRAAAWLRRLQLFEETPKVRKPLLAVILEKEGVLSALQVEKALTEWLLRRQRSTRASFGQVVLGLGLCSPAALMPCLAMQRKLATAPGGNRPLGTLLVEQGLMKPSDVVAALARQAASGQRLGELLRAEGALRQPQIDMVLMMQRRAA